MARSLVNDAWLGVVAGATGTVALDTATYLDMARRGRASSETPANAAEAIADKLGAHTPVIAGQPNHAPNRQSGMGALLGYATGCSLGVAYGLARPWLNRSTPLVSALVLGALSLAASDTPAIALRQTHPRSRSIPGWLAALAPHLIYGYVTAYTFEALWSRSATRAEPKPVTEGGRQANRLAQRIAEVEGAVLPKQRTWRWPALFVAARNATP